MRIRDCYACRMRERELARQQAAIAAGVSGPTPGGGGAGGGANFYQCMSHLFGRHSIHPEMPLVPAVS